jgi:hypothetical protein
MKTVQVSYRIRYQEKYTNDQGFVQMTKRKNKDFVSSDALKNWYEQNKNNITLYYMGKKVGA